MGHCRFSEADYWGLLRMLREYENNKRNHGQNETKCKSCKKGCNERDNGMSPRAKAYLEFLHDWYKAETRDDDKGLS